MTNIPQLSTIATIAGTIIGILSIFVAFYIYHLSKIGAQLSYIVKTKKLIGKKYQELPNLVDISYGGEKVTELYRTCIWMWNSGKQTLDGGMIVKEDVIRFILKNNFLNAFVASKTRSVNKSIVKIHATRKNIGIIDFDFLDPKDGIRVDIYHRDEENNIQIKGTVKGIPSGFKNLSSKKSNNSQTTTKLPRKSMPKGFVIFLLGLGFIFIVAGLLPENLYLKITSFLDSMGNNNCSVSSDVPSRAPFLISGVAYIILPFFIILTKRKKYPEILDKDINPQ